jgi:NAD(P)-dependent dehydrogenase (short-subunit alcohol dehydrogenase family)
MELCEIYTSNMPKTTKWFGDLIQGILGDNIISVTSFAGIITFPTTGIYCASKWALEGLTETLASEVADLGIKVTLIEPGGYDTDWRKDSADHTVPMPIYDPLRKKLAEQYGNSNRIGNPLTTVETIFNVVDSTTPPLRIFLGAFPLPIVKKVYAERLALWEEWSQL